MKTRFLSFVIVVLIGFTACSESHNNVAAVPVTDSLMKPWMDSWNTADIEKISACFAGDAMLIIPGAMMNGIDSIRKNWIIPSAKAIRNLTINNLNEVKSAEMACISGSYTHDWVKNDSVVDHAKGYYSFLWRKQADDSWKLAVVNLN